MRLFVGIPLAAKVVEELSAISMRLQANGDGLRWSAPESWHITLQFLGSTGPVEYDCIVAQLRALHSPIVAIQLEGLGFFDRAGVFFAGVVLTPELQLLQQRVAAATSPCGFIPETRPYHPHITLARSKSKGSKLQGLKSRIRRQPEFTGFVAQTFVLYESVARPGGSHYERKDQFSLAGT